MKESFAALAIFFGLTVTPVLARAHEGHNHQPAGVVAPHGGTIQTTEQYHVEVVKMKGGVKVFVFDHDLKPVAPDTIKVSAKVAFPKKAKADPVEWTVNNGAYEAKIDAKGSHRFTLNLELSSGKKVEKSAFQIEPME